jgi:hypothetical protein
MVRRAASLIVIAMIAMIACGAPSPRQPLYSAGTERDDGHGLLGRASASLLTSDEAEVSLFPARPPARHKVTDIYGGDGYGGDTYGMYGGGAYGGASYATYVVPPWGYPSANRSVRYTQKAGLTAAIEGVVTWRGPTPPKLTTSCGAVESLRVAADHSVGGVLVYIEHVSVGRTLPHDGGERRPSSVGGVLVKRGCTLEPTVQVVTPLPAALAIHGDARRARLVIVAPAPIVPKPLELQEGGRIELPARSGITQIAGDDGSLGAAWVIGLDTPYYAITDDTGRFRIDELAAGTYEVTFWQPPIATVSGGKLAYGAPIVVRRSIKVDTTKTSRLDIALGR